MKPVKLSRPYIIISFIEDDFDPVAVRNRIIRAWRRKAAAIRAARRRQQQIIAIRVIMPIAAVLISLWLYTMVDNLIRNYQYQRFMRALNFPRVNIHLLSR